MVIGGKLKTKGNIPVAQLGNRYPTGLSAAGSCVNHPITDDNIAGLVDDQKMCIEVACIGRIIAVIRIIRNDNIAIGEWIEGK